MRTRLIVVIVLSLSCPALAGPVLLGSFGGVAGSGATELTDPRAQLGLLVTPFGDTGEGVSLDNILFSTGFLRDGESGEYWFDADTIPKVAEFGEVLTNGTNDLMGILTVWAESVHVGIRGDSESFFLGRDTSVGELPDFVGFRLDSIRLIVRDVTIEPFVVREQEGLLARFDFSYEFYGSPIPEPGTCGLLAIGSLALWKRKALRPVPHPLKTGPIR
jgi:hypothetical protein